MHAALCTLIDVVEHGGASGLVFSSGSYRPRGVFEVGRRQRNVGWALEQQPPTASPSSRVKMQKL